MVCARQVEADLEFTMRPKWHGRWEENTFITKVTISMHKDFSTIMQQLHKEASEGALTTRWQAVHRRNQLLGHSAITDKDLAEATGNGCNTTDT